MLRSVGYQQMPGYGNYSQQTGYIVPQQAMPQQPGRSQQQAMLASQMQGLSLQQIGLGMGRGGMGGVPNQMGSSQQAMYGYPPSMLPQSGAGSEGGRGTGRHGLSNNGQGK